MDFHAEAMNTATIRNTELLDILNRHVDIARKVDIKKVRTPEMEHVDMKEWVSKEYLDKIVYDYRDHSGYPRMLYGFELAADKFRYDDIATEAEITKEYEEVCEELTSFLGVHRRALSCVYPPGGFISWHNNANASGYNVIFTWSENGDGQWEHIDPITKEHVIIKDVPGWQCKYGYYGSYDDGLDKVLYHCAHTNCLRMTFGFVFNRDESGKRMAEMLIEEIETE
jgi:hypothetical protein